MYVFYWPHPQQAQQPGEDVREKQFCQNGNQILFYLCMCFYFPQTQQA